MMLMHFRPLLFVKKLFYIEHTLHEKDTFYLSNKIKKPCLSAKIFVASYLPLVNL